MKKQQLPQEITNDDENNLIVEMAQVEVTETILYKEVYKGMIGFYYGTVRGQAIIDLLDKDGHCYRTVYVPKRYIKLCHTTQ